MDIRQGLNTLFVELFRDINSIEEERIRTGEFSNLTINDMHVIDAIGTGKAKNMSSVAKLLNVTVGSLTISVNGLDKKGIVERVRSEEDRRVVLVSLTAAGKRAYKKHEEFHDEMIEAIVAELSEEERQIMARGLEGLRDFFLQYKE